MLNRIVSVVGGAVKGMGRFGGESMERAATTTEKMGAVAKPIEKAPVPQVVITHAESLEAKAMSGKGGPRAALKELAEKKPEEPKEESQVEPHKDDDDTMANILEQAMATPDVDQKPLPDPISQTITEIPIAIGEKTKNTPNTV